jgi:cellulose synthase/poly-beta-1,6-N-acetylglucosamine synthase-like glycosyltransferase
MLGSSIALKVLFFAGAFVVTGDFAATLFTILYQKIIYRNIRSKFNASYAPMCSIIVPCKGIPKNFGNNLRGFLQLEYSNYEVIYVTESAKDSAVPEIRKILTEDKRAKFTVAGLAESCAQKNYNLLAALKLASGSSEVFVFADSDIKPAKEWLKEIVLPLQNNKVTVTTGFRWLTSTAGSVGELCHSYINIFIYTCFCAACYFGGVGLWGGSMAIRRKDFEELAVAEKWASAAVDDMSLSAVAFKNRRKAMVVPNCVTVSDDLIETMSGATSWFERQIMYLKAYQKGLWIFTLSLVTTAALLLCLLPAAVLGAFLTNNTNMFWTLGGGVSLFFIAGHTLVAMLYPLLGKMPYFGRFLLIQPVLRMTHVIAYLKTWFTHTITWAGIKYQLSSNGDVKKLERPQPQEVVENAVLPVEGIS